MFGFGKNDNVRDPVCGMNVDKNKARFSHEKNGEKFYFCSQNCKDTFTQESKKPVKSDSKSCC